jgi:hypothetical protein
LFDTSRVENKPPDHQNRGPPTRLDQAAIIFEDSMPETLFIVDMNSLVFQVFHAIPEMTGPNGQPTNAVFGFTRDLQTIRALPGATYLICALDVAGPAVRNEVFAEYKANGSAISADHRGLGWIRHSGSGLFWLGGR